MDTLHFEQSSYREVLIEHLFTAELMKYSWLEGADFVEIAKPQVDRTGYDLVLEASGIIRHVQLKSTHLTSRLSQIELPIALAAKPGGCAIVVRFHEKTLELGPFHFFGGAPGEPLPDMSRLRVARRKLRNREGIRTERPGIRCVGSPNSKLFPQFGA